MDKCVYQVYIKDLSSPTIITFNIAYFGKVHKKLNVNKKRAAQYAET